MHGSWKPVDDAVAAIERDERLDATVGTLSGLVERVLPTGAARDLLHGVWLGHPLHPLLTDLPIGFWTSAMVVDVLSGRAGAPAARTLVAFGCLTALPTAASGAADWSRADRGDQRIGVVHAVANSVALGLYTWSWVERRRGRRARGIAVSFAAAAAATAGGFLGGHLVYRRAVGANRVVDVDPPTDWTDARTDSSSARPSGIELVDVDGTGVVVEVDAGVGIAARCSHAGGPLGDGDVLGDGPDRCVVCPWHGSTFRLADGTVVHGPATSPQPAYEARHRAGHWQVRRRRP